MRELARPARAHLPLLIDRLDAVPPRPGRRRCTPAEHRSGPAARRRVATAFATDIGRTLRTSSRRGCCRRESAPRRRKTLVSDGRMLLRHPAGSALPARDEDRPAHVWPEWRIIGPHLRIAGELYRPDLLCGAS